MLKTQRIVARNPKVWEEKQTNHKYLPLDDTHSMNVWTLVYSPTYFMMLTDQKELRFPPICQYA